VTAALGNDQCDLDGYLFGLGTSVRVAGLDIGTAKAATNDTEVDQADRIRFGRDWLRSRTLTFDLIVVTESMGAAQDALDELTGVWDAQELRRTSGKVVPLRLAFGGRIRRVYGRPRKLASDLGTVAAGVAKVTAEFVTRDPLFYADDQDSASVDIVPPSGSDGLTVPFTAPVVLEGEAASQGVFRVGGTAGAAMVVRIHGPITDPRVRLSSTDGEHVVNVRLQGHLPADDALTVDPTAHTVLTELGTNWAGAFTADSTPLSQLALPPGDAHILLSGHDHTGTASASVAWRAAYHSF
jgi:hypothetical protein